MVASAQAFTLDSSKIGSVNPKSFSEVPAIKIDDMATSETGASSESNSTGSQSPNLSPSSVKLKFQEELMDAEATLTATAYEASTLGRRMQTKDAKSVVDLLERNATLFPHDDAIVFIDDGCNIEQRLTYSQFYNKVTSMAVHIKKENLAGQPVLILLPPGLDYFVAFMGCLTAGAIAVPLYPPNPSRLKRELPRLVEVVKDSGAVCGITTSQASLLFKSMVFGQGSHLRQLKWIAMEKTSNKSAEFKKVHIDGDSVAFLQYSSGSTGVPKGVMVTHRNVTYNCWLIMNEFDLRSTDVGLSWLPPYHDLGLIGAFLLPICGGRTCYFMSPLSFLKRPMLWLEAISKFKVTLSGGPNFAYDLICSKSTPEERAKVDLTTWKYVFSGAEPVRVATINRFEEMFGSYGFRREHFRNCYGLAENTLLVSMSQVTQAPKVMVLDSRELEMWHVKEVAGPAEKYTPGSVRSIVSCGRVPDSEHVAVVDPETHELAGPSKVGELWACGGSKTKGYWRNEERTEEVFRAKIKGANDNNEWLRTGDLAYIDEQGEVFICGRLKDVIIIRGRNHFPQDIEQTVENSHRALRKGCCAAFSVEVDGEEKLVVSIETRVSPSPSKAELKEAMQAIKNNVYENHGIQIYTLNLLYPNTINKTTSGKIQRFACRKAFTADQLQVVDKSVVGANGDIAEPESLFAIVFKWMLALLPIWLISYLMPQNVMQDALNRTTRFPDSSQTAALIGAQGKVKPGPELSIRIIELQLISAVSDQLKLEPSEIDVNEPLTSYGFDSMAAANFCSALEKSYGVKFPPLLLSEYRSVEALARYLALGESYAGGATTPDSPDEEAPKVERVAAHIPAAVESFAPAPPATPTDGTLPCIMGIGNHNPGEKVNIMEMASIFDQMLGLPEDQRRRLDRICEHSAIEYKYSVLDPIKDQHLFSLDSHSKKLCETASTEMRNNIYVREAPKLAHAAALKAIEDWGGDKNCITHVVSVSCTGLITPGLEFQVMKSLGLPMTTQRLNIGMMGCFGALSGLKTAKALAAENPTNRVLLVCCELCSLHFQSELDTETLVGSALFGDGAGAVIVGCNPKPGENALYELGRSASTIIPNTEGLMTWELTDNGLKMGLKPEIPLEIYKTIKPFTQSMLPSPDITFHDCAFPVHPGGKSIIQAIENACELKPRQTEATWEVLKNHGNMSSATVLFILNKMRHIGFDVEHAIALAFGPGLNVEGLHMRLLGARGTEKF